MAQHLDRHIEILLPALVLVNSYLKKDIGGLVWYWESGLLKVIANNKSIFGFYLLPSCNSPFEYLDFNMPRFPQPPNPKNLPYAHRPAPFSTVTPTATSPRTSCVTLSLRPSSSTGTPCVTLTSQPTSSGNHLAHTSGTSNSPANTAVGRQPKTVMVCDPDNHKYQDRITKLDKIQTSPSRSFHVCIDPLRL
ncbi:hypothetical protein DFH28DRAFT_930742 [Melampsora americana]|nr:hypothetical protein DFH28DRAFT_930742 [Melampsora americana]